MALADSWIDLASPEELAELDLLLTSESEKAKRLLDLFPPNSEPQKQFIESQADIAIYGGSAGGGKTFAELLEPTQDIHNPNFGAVIFRRTMKQVKDEGGIWDQSAELYSKVGGVPNLTERFWTFPSGATIQFAGLEAEESKYTYQGAQIPDMLFDELTHFTEGQFFYLLSRNRSQCGARTRVRATTNPEPGWVKKLIAPWVDKNHPNPATSGEVRWFVRKGDVFTWIDQPPLREPCTRGNDGSGCYAEGCEACFPPEKSITFIRAKLYDNKDLLKANPGYVASLMAMHSIDRKRLLDGDWDVQKTGALVSEEIIERTRVKCLPPEIVMRVIAIDPTISDPEKKRNPSKEPDDCGIVVMSLAMIEGVGHLFIENDLSGKYSPAVWSDLVKKLAKKLHWKGRPVNQIVYEENQGGELVRDVLTEKDPKELLTCPIIAVHASVNKRARAEPVAALWENGRVHIVNSLPALEDEWCTWNSADTRSPGRIDATVWGAHAMGLAMQQEIMQVGKVSGARRKAS